MVMNMLARIALILPVLVATAAAQEWPGWRGPRGDGTTDEKEFPVAWGPDKGILWKVAVPGKAHSSPVVWGDRVYLTTCVESSEERKLICLDRDTGKTVWERVVLKSKLERKHRLNSFASSTPVTDGEHLWVAFFDAPRFLVYCYTLDGKLLWRKQPGEFHSKHGFCSSPVLYGDTVIFNGDQDAKAWLVALDKKTGEERWRTDRPNRTRSYTPPVIFEAAGRPQMVLSGSKCVASYDPATGKQHWIIDGPTEQFVASLVYTEGIFFVTGGFPDHYLIGIRPDGRGNVTKSHVLWELRDGVSYVPSPLAVEKNFYVVSDGGVASCIDAKTGKRHWMERLGSHHSSSPVAAGGHLYFPDDGGTVHVLKAGTTFEVVARNDMGEGCRASPALSRGRIYIRTLGHLVCIGKGAE